MGKVHILVVSMLAASMILAALCTVVLLAANILQTWRLATQLNNLGTKPLWDTDDRRMAQALVVVGYLLSVFLLVTLAFVELYSHLPK